MVDFAQFTKANIAYIVLGYPNLEITEQFLRHLDQSPIDILELGIAYSDPIADGHIISNAATIALEQGMNIHKVFEFLPKIKTKKTLVFMVYYNLILSYGLENFVRKARALGICALIVPELNYEESKPLYKQCQKYNLALITLISVTTPRKRIEKLVKRAKGFIYLLASIGITGGKRVADKLLKKKIKQIRSLTKLPIYVGFGVKNNTDVKNMRKLADGVIVGTRIVELFANHNIKELLEAVEEIFEK